MKIGIPYVADEGAIYSGLGIKANASNPQTIKAEVAAILKYVNARGGFGGHPVVPVFYAYNASGDGGNFAQLMQAECSYFTQDNPVFAVDSFVQDTFPPLPNCLAQHHVLLIDADNSVAYEQHQAAPWQPYYLLPFSASMTRLTVETERLLDRGWATRTNRIGVLRFDNQQGADAESAAAAVLARHGLGIVKDYAFAPLDSLDAISTDAQESSNAVLSFHAAGIDKVLLLSTQAVSFFFADNAESQQYRPDYGMSTLDLPAYVVANVPAAQARHMLAIGWNRLFDVDYEAVTPADAKLPAIEQCRRIEAAGQVSNGDPFACDTFALLQTALAGTRTLSAQSLRASLTSMGSFGRSAQSLGVRFPAGRFDGASTARYVTYAASCACMTYVGKEFTLP